jgi:hypothetical protein
MMVIGAIGNNDEPIRATGEDHRTGHGSPAFAMTIMGSRIRLEAGPKGTVSGRGAMGGVTPERPKPHHKSSSPGNLRAKA